MRWRLPSEDEVVARRTVLVLAAVGALAALLMAPFVWARVPLVGSHLSNWDATRDYLWALGWAPVLSATLLLWPVPAREKKALAIAWGAKVLVALGIMIFYETHYLALDAFGYYARPLTPGAPMPRLTLGDGFSSMDALVWALARVTPDSYHALKLDFAYIGLLGAYAFYRAGALLVGRRDARVFLAFALFPSVLFWSSILGKDPIAFLALGFAAWGLALLHARRLTGVLALAGSFAVLLFVRTWLIAIVLVPTLFVGLALATRMMRPARRVAVAACALLLLVGIGAAESTVLHAVPVLHLSAKDPLALLNEESRAWAEGGSGETPPAFTSWGTVLRFLPLGMFTALFRPLPGELKTPVGLLAGLESLALLALLACTAWRRSRARVRTAATAWLVLFVLTWSAVYAFLSYQNLGTAVRFRLQVIPFLVLIAFHLTSRADAA